MDDAAADAELDMPSLAVVRVVATAARGGEILDGPWEGLIQCVKRSCTSAGGIWCDSCGRYGQCGYTCNVFTFISDTMLCIDSYLSQVTV